MRYPEGTKVRIGGDLGKWTRTAQESLNGATGVVEEYKHDYGFGDGPAHLIRLDKPAQLNPISWSDNVWVHIDNVWKVW
jgi:hypothetical protein